MQSYLIHSNRYTPFKVTVEDIYTAYIYKNLANEWNLIAKYVCEEIFIGKSPRIPMTEFSGGHGPKFDGNSILLHLSCLDYVYIGDKIYTFTARAKIIEYISPVGNNDVPYPYASDTAGNIYLLEENVILLHTENLRGKIRQFSSEPYSYYYKCSKITSKHNNIYWLIDDMKYTLNYTVNAAEIFDSNVKSASTTFVVGKTKIEMSRDEFIAFVEKFGKDNLFAPIEGRDHIYK
jgi:hypothetical protein